MSLADPPVLKYKLLLLPPSALSIVGLLPEDATNAYAPVTSIPPLDPFLIFWFHHDTEQ